MALQANMAFSEWFMIDMTTILFLHPLQQQQKPRHTADVHWISISQKYNSHRLSMVQLLVASPLGQPLPLESCHGLGPEAHPLARLATFLPSRSDAYRHHVFICTHFSPYFWCIGRTICDGLEPSRTQMVLLE